MTPLFSHIPNLDAGVLEFAVREQEIDGESLLLLTQVSPRRIPSVCVLRIRLVFPDLNRIRILS
jgi:hypothetical protein